MHRDEVREDWKALEKKSSTAHRVTRVTWVSLKAPQQGREGWESGEGWVDRGEVGEITGSSPTLSVSLPVPVLLERGNEGL